ncbi:XRP2-like protein [Chloropicon primus]|uniref:XRP2-like protein n=1 Tax=Chloropicon primus TaxID=1764295 RepID=A0A5B8MPS3_9CHLO|nr:XRP2-like protein [Chloropicon primus]UPR00496.1 XRP2-like protein [Chloropicon primus]|eukprot:QDZ21282.1 XRP2-like protein [Chloropicon primus]
MGCLLSRLYDSSLRTRAARSRSHKYRLNDPEEVETKTLSPSSTSVPNYSASSGNEAPKPKSSPTVVRKDEAPKKEYSWDKRRKLDPKDFMCINTEDETIVKEPGKINGQQFVVDGCKRCKILVFDHCASVTIDDCSDCTIFIGPTESSVFIRNCKNCVCLFLCRQLRTRDCTDCKIRLFCSTRPVIESSSGMSFACFDSSCEYEQLAQQLSSAHLSTFCNYWSSVYDFTPKSSSSNWSFLNHSGTGDFDAVAQAQSAAGLVTPTEEDRTMFDTLGEQPLEGHEYHYLVLFPLRLKIQEPGAAIASKAFLRAILASCGGSGKEAKLVQVNGCKLAKDEIDEFNGNNVLDSNNSIPSNAAKVIGIEVASKESMKSAVVQAITGELSKYDCILVDQLELMTSFRTKGITG